MANSIDQLQYVKTISSLYTAAANSSTTSKTPAPNLDQTPADRGTEDLRVELSEQGKMQAAARNTNGGQQPAEPLNKAAANLQKFGSELATKAASTNITAEEKARLNEQMTAVNKALSAMGENNAPTAAKAATNNATPSAFGNPLADTSLATREDATAAGKTIGSVMKQVSQDLAGGRISEETAGKAFSMLNEAASKAELAASQGSTENQRLALNKELNNIRTSFNKLETSTNTTQTTAVNNQTAPAEESSSARSTMAGLMTRETDKARAALEAMRSFSAATATGPNPMSQSASEAGTRQRISIVI